MSEAVFEDNQQHYEIRVEFYVDDFNNTQKPRNQIIGAYFGINNLPYWMQSQRRELFVSGFGKRCDFKTIGIKKFFDPIRAEMESLRKDYLKDDDGNIIRLNGKPIYVTMLCVIADNKGANEVMGITSSFYNSACCRYCTSHWRDIQLNPTLRGPARREDGNCLLYGVIQGTIPFTPDIFHDLNEGVTKKMLESYLTKFYTAADLKILTDRITSLNMRQGRINELKRVDSPPKVAIYGTGMQIWELFLAFDFFDRKVPRNSLHWEVYTLLRRICIRLHWTTIRRSHLRQLQRDIEDFVIKYVQAIECNVFPKLHNMLHYNEIIESMGPLMRYSTVRFERMHQTFLRKLAPSRCYKNQAYSLMDFYETTWIPQLFTKRRQKAIEESRLATGVHHVRQCLLKNGLLINAGKVYVIKGSGDFEQIEFAKITEIVKIDNEHFFFGFKLEMIENIRNHYAKVKIVPTRVNIESTFPYHRDVHVYSVGPTNQAALFILNEFDFS